MPKFTRYGTSSEFSRHNTNQTDEDWTNVTDLAERRRIQNRIAQRSYRMRLKERLAQLERQAERQTERQAKRQAASSFLQPAGEDSVLTDPYDRHDHCHARAMDKAQIHATEPTGPVVQPALDIPCIQRARDNGTASCFSHHHFTSSRHASKSPPPLDSTAYSTPEDTASEDVEYLLYPYLEPSYIISGNTFAGLLDPSTPPMFPLPAMECGGSVDPTCHYPAIDGIDDLTWDYE